MDWRKKYTQLRHAYGRVFTNYFSYSPSKALESYIEVEGGYATIVRKKDMNIMYFAAATVHAFESLIERVPANTIVNYAYKEKGKNELEPWTEQTDMEKYATYMRTTVHYVKNPYLEEEVPRRRILQKMYDPFCGEYPAIEDIPQMESLWRELFDPVCDDSFDYEEWKSIVENKEALIFREAGEIIAAYIYRFQGKKLYSNISMNIGGANVLYNMERRIFQEAWDKGIRIFYGWGNISNVRAHTHALPETIVAQCVDKVEHLFSDTFYKK